ncbi:MAG: hypothetical protein R2822_19075 [Spirosomataceae bacterium]
MPNNRILGRIEDIEKLNLRQEKWTQLGLKYIRKIQDGKVIYFIANQDQRFTEGWITLATTTKSVAFYDPLTHKTTPLPTRREGKEIQVYVDLPSGASCFLMLDTHSNKANPALSKTPKTVIVKGRWQLDFLEGRPYTPSRTWLDKPISWSSLSDSASYFAGTARYSMTLDVPQGYNTAKKIILDLGDVREVADVTLNGQKIGTAWCLPFQLEIPKNALKQGANQIAIEVTNLSANYMRLRDTQQPEWKKFQEINMVDIQYKPFDASQWKPMPSGLLGEVKLLFFED